MRVGGVRGGPLCVGVGMGGVGELKATKQVRERERERERERLQPHSPRRPTSMTTEPGSEVDKETCTTIFYPNAPVLSANPCVHSLLQEHGDVLASSRSLDRTLVRVSRARGESLLATRLLVAPLFAHLVSCENGCHDPGG